MTKPDLETEKSTELIFLISKYLDLLTSSCSSPQSVAQFPLNLVHNNVLNIEFTLVLCFLLTI